MLDRVQRKNLAIPIHRLEHRTRYESDRNPLFDRDHQGPGELGGHLGTANQRMLLETQLDRRQVVEYADER